MGLDEMVDEDHHLLEMIFKRLISKCSGVFRLQNFAIDRAFLVESALAALALP